MAVIRFQVNLNSPIPGTGYDGAVNTWYFANIGTSTPAESAADAHGWLTTFYQAIDSNFPTALVSTPLETRAYNLADAEPRTPIFTGTIATVTDGTDYLGPELAVCLSYRTIYRSGVRKGRQRGRVYLGPIAEAQNVNGRPASAMVTSIATAAGALLTSSQASTDTVWRVHSELEPDSSDMNVAGGWVDNEWDVQRRRSLNVTSRTAFGVGH